MKLHQITEQRPLSSDRQALLGQIRRFATDIGSLSRRTENRAVGNRLRSLANRILLNAAQLRRVGDEQEPAAELDGEDVPTMLKKQAS